MIKKQFEEWQNHSKRFSDWYGRHSELLGRVGISEDEFLEETKGAFLEGLSTRDGRVKVKDIPRYAQKTAIKRAGQIIANAIS